MNDQHYRALLDYRMCSDGVHHSVNMDAVDSLMDEEARERGFQTWIDAYHGWHPNPEPPNPVNEIGKAIEAVAQQIEKDYPGCAQRLRDVNGVGASQITREEMDALMSAGDALSQVILNAQGDNPSEAARAAWPSGARQMRAATEWLEAARVPRIKLYGDDDADAALCKAHSQGSAK